MIYDTKERKKVELRPLKDNTFRLYTCGPTVYNYPHIGNYRTFLFEDLLRRYLKYKGYQVFQVMNLTDVDDKTIRESTKKNITLNDYTKEYINAFFEDIDNLRIERAEVYPRATDHIDEMINIISRLFDKGYAYKSGDSIYFDVSKFSDYGKLSGTTRLQGDTKSRIDQDEYDRDSIKDFVLWKGHKDGEPYWDSPWGKGRPGWHIECSAMSMKYLGDFFDLHTGGVDNIFPHHENEIAQSVAFSEEQFVNHWMHAEFLLVENEKMSKSKGNYYTIRDLAKKGYSLLAFRYLVLTTHYRKQLNFTFDSLKASQSAIDRLNEFHFRLNSIKDGSDENNAILKDLDKMMEKFHSSMDDDLNTSKAMSHIFDFIKIANTYIDKNQISKNTASKLIKVFSKLNTIFDFFIMEKNEISHEIMVLIEERERARKNKDYKKADELRDKLKNDFSIILKDTKEGVIWKKI